MVQLSLLLAGKCSPLQATLIPRLFASLPFTFEIFTISRICIIIGFAVGEAMQNLGTKDWRLRNRGDLPQSRYFGWFGSAWNGHLYIQSKVRDVSNSSIVLPRHCNLRSDFGSSDGPTRTPGGIPIRHAQRSLRISQPLPLSIRSLKLLKYYIGHQLYPCSANVDSVN